MRKWRDFRSALPPVVSNIAIVSVILQMYSCSASFRLRPASSEIDSSSFFDYRFGRLASKKVFFKNFRLVFPAKTRHAALAPAPQPQDSCYESTRPAMRLVPSRVEEFPPDADRRDAHETQ